MDYTEKYLEYKNKYMSLKNQLKNQPVNQSGGANDIGFVVPIGGAFDTPFVPLSPVFKYGLDGSIVSVSPIGPVGQYQPIISTTTTSTDPSKPGTSTTYYVPVRDQYSTPLHYNPYPPRPSYYDTGVYNPTVYYDDNRSSIRSSRKSSKRSSRKSSRRSRK